MAFTKTACPITRNQFDAAARPLGITIEGKSIEAEVKEFASGSMGWYYGGKLTIEVGGVRLQCQVGLNITVVGSKELPK